MTASEQFTALSPTQGTLQSPLLKPCYLHPIHSTLHTSVKQIFQEHLEYLSILSSFNVITSLTYMHYKIFASCHTIIGATCTYMQQNSTPCPSKPVIVVYSIVFTPQNLRPLMLSGWAVRVNTVPNPKRLQ